MSKHHLLSITVAISLLVVLLVGFLPNSALFVVIKFLLILALGGGVFFYLKDLPVFSEVDFAEEERDGADTLSHDVPPEVLKIKADQNVEEYFESFLATIFPIIKQTMIGKTVVLLMVNYYKKKFYVRYKLTESGEHFNKEPFFDLNQGLLAIILRNKKTLIENHLPDSENLLPYYALSRGLAKSFLGVPLFFEDYVVGILCVDSPVEEAFSPDDLKILNDFSKVIAIQLASSNKLYEYETENWTTRFLYDFSKGILQIQTVKDLWQYIDASLKPVFASDRLIISERVDQDTGKVVYMSGPANSLRLEDEYLVNEGIVGWVFRKNQSLLVEDFSKKENYIPRFFRDEFPAREFKSFIAVPVVENEMTQAVLSLESYKANHFNEQHKKILETMAYQIASFLDKARIMQQLRAQSTLDPKTRLGNSRALMTELNKEICRSTEFRKQFSLQIVKIYTPHGTIEENIYDRLISEFVSFILPLLSPANYIFRLNNNHLAIVWPEKIFREVASDFQMILTEVEKKRPWVDGLVERANVNCGIVQFPTMGENGTELLDNARKALAEAELKGPNVIEVYQDAENINTQGE